MNLNNAKKRLRFKEKAFFYEDKSSGEITTATFAIF